ncbi:uncharacterized protein C8R40DRAFT_1072657 [Lentinula edodes]|uniref:uncharacterized protein n=1 Tax=Lentinula edodes TaxID=5353 RepID=UPI001E8CAC00|nr:uncharacterized protein C8R40DRAFT_1072657 [Lentinula edodes]KAH7871108.1 hypothetical protein C8R40DRAFT_1072657 [Lentinula edodes]
MHLTVPASLLYILLMGFISVVNAAPATIKVTDSANSNIVSESHLESRTGEHHQAGEGVQHFPMIVVYITAIRAVVITTGHPPDKQLKFQDEVVQSRLEARLKFYFKHTWKCDADINFVGNLEFIMVDVEGGFSFKYKKFPDYKKILRSGFVSESNPPSPLGSSYDSLNSDTHVTLQVPQRS